MKIPVLFTNEKSNYNNYSIFDTYSKKRNAFTYYSRSPLIAHPPCRLFSRLRGFSTANKSEKKLAFFALSRVRQFGGILEHPRSSTLWKNGNFNLSGNIDEYGGFLRSVNLSWFGYPCEKKTMLYFVGIKPGDLPPFPLNLLPPSSIISTSRSSTLPEIPKKDRSSTPAHMIEYFIEVMQIINNKNQKPCTTN
jgi:hypothetical protein